MKVQIAYFTEQMSIRSTEKLLCGVKNRDNFILGFGYNSIPVLALYNRGSLSFATVRAF